MAHSLNLKQGFIKEIQDDTRRKNYVLTECGMELVKMQHERIKILYDNGVKIVEEK